MSGTLRTVGIILLLAAASAGAISIILFRQTDMGRAAARAAVPVPLAERVRDAESLEAAPGPFPATGTRAWIEGPDGTIVSRTLPWATFALERGQSLDPRIPPGPATVLLEVTFRPRGDALGRVGGAITGLSMILERPADGADLWVDAASTRTRESLSGSPQWMRQPVERLDYTLRRTRDGAMSFRAIREPFDEGRVRPLASAGRPFRAIGPGGGDAPPATAWPGPDEPFPLDALIGALDRGRCTDCHAFHARRPLTRPADAAAAAAPDLAEASLRGEILALAAGLSDCDDRAAAAGMPIPRIDRDDAAAIARLLVQSAGRLPSAEAAAAEAAAAEAAAAEAAAADAAEADAAEASRGDDPPAASPPGRPDPAVTPEDIRP
ncbi:MAG: hypothetical protein ACYTEV_13040 [Planctomycetota bacterium]|jgi:hypothetical protein